MWRECGKPAHSPFSPWPRVGSKRERPRLRTARAGDGAGSESPPSRLWTAGCDSPGRPPSRLAPDTDRARRRLASRPAPSRSSEGPGNRAGGASAVTHSRARRRRLPANRLCGGRGRATLDLGLLRFLRAQKRAQCKQERESLCRQTQRFDTWQTARRCPAPSPQVLTPRSRLRAASASAGGGSVAAPGRAP